MNCSNCGSCFEGRTKQEKVSYGRCQLCLQLGGCRRKGKSGKGAMASAISAVEGLGWGSWD